MELTITIVNYDKYKGRKDVENNSWFRLSNRFLEDSDFFDFSSEEKLVWIYLLSVASQKNTAKLVVNHRHAHHVCGLSLPSINSAVKKLSKIGILKIDQARTSRGRYVADTPTGATDRQTDITNKHNTPTHADAFADFYSGYPRKIGRAQGLKAYLRERKSGATAEDLLLARDKFRKHHETTGTDPKFIPYPSTMLSDWKQWLDPETGSSDLSSPNMSITDILREQREKDGQ